MNRAAVFLAAAAVVGLCVGPLVFAAAAACVAWAQWEGGAP